MTETNLEELDALTDEMIDTSDIPPLTEEFFCQSRMADATTQSAGYS